MFMLMVLSIGVNAQKYLPFPTENSQWNIKLSKGDNYTPYSCELLKYVLQGDTIYNGKTYHKLYFNAGTLEKPQYTIKGGLCEINKQIFYHDFSIFKSGYLYNIMQKSNELRNCTKNQLMTVSDEFLLYDFNKTKIGDTLFTTPWGNPILISGIDSVLIQNQYRKRYTCGSLLGEYDYVIEGIGSVKQGLLGAITPMPMCGGYNWEFVCFSQNGESIYKNPDYVDCNSSRSWKDIPYVPFPTENAQWNEFYASSYNDSPIDTTLLKYSLQGDTIINSIQYKKVCRNTGTDAQPIYKGVGGLREVNKKIYYNGFGYDESHGGFENIENLLYDFNKKVGDTVTVNQWRKYPIIKIDSVKIGNEYRKRYNDCIIEGIGDVVNGLLGIMVLVPTCSMCHLEWHFVCFSQNGECVYKNPDFVDCNSVLKTALSDVKANIPLVKISPNPVKDILVIESIITDSPYTSVEVMDIMGKSVKTTLITNSAKSKLDLSDCMTGIYYVLVKYKDKTEAHKIIKM